MNHSREPAGHQYRAYAVICGCLLLSTIWLAGRERVDFSGFFGEFPPFLAVLLVSTIGAFCLSYLRKFGFMINRSGTGSMTYWMILVSGMVFAVMMVALDLFTVFPEDINTPLPEAILFYPVMGMVAEVAFHLIPMTVILGILSAFTDTNPNRIAAVVITAVVALVEPIFQVMAGFVSDPGWLVVAAMGFIIYIFNVVQLWLFRRYDLLTMYLFRIGYYLIWHLIWGYFRLSLLF